MTVDEMNTNVRNLVRQAMGMPAGSVRDADERSPMGGETSEIATVKIINVEDLGEPALSYAADTDTTKVDETVSLPRQFVASVQFYKSPTGDGAGRAKKSDAAFTRAARLSLLLSLSANLATMRTMGIGYLKASAPRNLSAVVAAGWESRGSVDLTFNVIASEGAAVDKIASVPLTVTMQNPDQTRSSEVIAP